MNSFVFPVVFCPIDYVPPVAEGRSYVMPERVELAFREMDDAPDNSIARPSAIVAFIRFHKVLQRRCDLSRTFTPEVIIDSFAYVVWNQDQSLKPSAMLIST